MDDDSFGPRLAGHFDFTLRFEHGFFQVLPASVMILMIPYFIRLVLKSPAVARAGVLLSLKLALAIAIAAIQLARVVLWYNSALNTPMAQVGSILSFLASLGTIAVAYASHKHCVQPATFLCLFLSGTFFLDLASVYTYFHRDSLRTLTWVTCTLPVLKLALVVAEEISKRPLLMSQEAQAEFGDELLAGFWSRSTFAWINPLLMFGFRNDIKSDGLPKLCHQFDSEAQFLAFKRHWDKSNKKDKFALLKCCIMANPWPFVHIIIPRLIQIGILFSQPFLLQDVVNFVSGTAPNDGIPQDQRGTGLIFATALVFFTRTITQNMFSHLRNQIVVSNRGILSTAIYRKTLNLPATEAEELASITLIAADIAGIERLISVCYDSWALLVETGVGLGVLSLFVGPASILVLVSATIVTILARYIAAQIIKTRKKWNAYMSVRVAETSTLLAQIRDLKMLGLAPSASVHLQKMYDTEVALAVNDRKMVALTFGVTSLAETSGSMLVIAGALFWTRAAHTIPTARFFSILTVTGIISGQWSWFLRTLPQWAAGYACLTRVQDYLNKDESSDPREQLLHAPENGGSDSSTKLSLQTEKREQYSIKIYNLVVCMDKDDTPTLKDITALIPAGETTMLYGAVGCGKSTFLRTLLGAIALKSGTVSLSSLSIAYAAQTTWIINASIRVNIVGHKAYNPDLYRKVVYICALDVDFQQLPDGDETMAGNAGASLSGGQKQRVSIARALYFEADITVLDDPLSALDKETSALVRRRLFAEGNATAQGRTMVMSTSMREHLADAQNILHITDDGRINKVSLEEAVTHPEDFSREITSHKMTKPDDVESVEDPPAVKEDDETPKKAAQSTRKDRGDFSLYKYYLAPAGALRVISWGFLTIWGSLSENFHVIFARIWQESDPANKLYYIGFAIICMNYPVAIASGAMFYYFIIHVRASTGLHKTLAAATFGATYEFLTNEDAGSILNRFSQDMAMGAQQVAAFFLPTTFRGITVLIDIGIISSGARYAAAIIPLFLFVTIGIQQYYLRTSRQLRFLELDTAKDMVRHLTETAHGIEHIRAFRWQDQVTKHFQTVFDVTQRPLYFLSCIQLWLKGILGFSTAVAAIIVVSMAVKFPHTASASSMGLALMTLIEFSEHLDDFISSSVDLETALGAVARIRAYGASTPAEMHPAGAMVPKDWPESGRVELNSLSAFYKPRDAAPFSPTSNITVVVEPGETLGVVGRTGSGKSTVLLSILNLLEYTGTINIDGREIRSLPPDELRARITTITQSAVTDDESNKRQVTRHEAEEWARRNGILEYVETSAKSGENVENAFMRVAERIYQNIQAGKYDLNDRRSGVKGPSAGGSRQVKLAAGAGKSMTGGCC
ncbi:hypothetical protein NLG97_g4290 [Lecanicillium saksenae]|uniref:Uncharacterized protein n=1 Tax=Lecanicillium saksenae TaxID=468837 RepID=A0ACC1QYC5_9HYPO|nr:hypothetical protein NLG97_g4290 [Lecanicillium saksenae]